MFESSDNSESTVSTNHILDSIANVHLFKLLRGYWHEARSAHADNREQQSIDDDYFDGIQWEDEDIAELELRGQKPLVYNEIKPAIEWIIGTEKRTKVEWKVLPRGEEDREGAEIKTKLLKYISDVNGAVFHHSRAFSDAVKVGVGWVETGVHIGSDDEPIFCRHESWRNIWLDPMSSEMDISDARYIIRSKVVDVDVAMEVFKERQGVIRAAMENAFNEYGILHDQDLHDVRQNIDNNMNNLAGLSNENVTLAPRKVIRLSECWYKVPTSIQILRGGNLDGQKFDPMNAEMSLAIQNQDSIVYQSFRMQTRVAIFCYAGLLQDMESPYQHNRFPFVPLWGYRRGRDNMPYGIIRGCRDPQQDLNKRRSKSLFLLSVNRTIMDEGAVKDIDEYIEESARPDAVIIKRPGKELSIETNVQLAEEHINLAVQSSEYIRNISGVTGENLGQQTNATSGKAILARQNQGTVTTASLFDNKRFFVELIGKIELSLVEQFMDFHKVIRIVGPRGAQEFISINELMPDGSIKNPITLSQADFKVAEQDYRESYRMAIFEQLMDLLSKLPGDIALSVLDIVMDFSDAPGKDELVRRIRQMNGYADPNDPNSADIEEQNQQAKSQQQQQDRDLEVRRIESEIRRNAAMAEQNEASSLVTKIESMLKSIEAASVVVKSQPVITETANDLLLGAEAASPGNKAKF